MTHFIEGKQYLVTAIGGASQPAELVALTLPYGAEEPCGSCLASSRSVHSSRRRPPGAVLRREDLGGRAAYRALRGRVGDGDVRLTVEFQETKDGETSPHWLSI